MSLLRGKRTWTAVLYSRITLAILLAVSAFLALSVYERFSIEREMAERRRDVETELSELQKRKADLEEKVEYLSNEEGIEAEIRTHFDVAREGEQVVIIVDRESDASAQSASVQEAVKDEGFWSRFLPW